MTTPTFQWGDFSEKQLLSVANATARANIWHGAVRSGKTVGSIIRWLTYLQQMKHAKGQFLMSGVTIGTLKDNILDPISEMVGPENFHYTPGSREAWICGVKVLIRGAGDEGSEKKIRGITLKGHYGDEITLWPKSYYKRGMDRLSVDGAKAFFTTNPDSPYHHIKTDFIDRGFGPWGNGEINLRHFHFELEDNLNLPEEYVEDLKKEFTGLWYKRYIQGLWVVAEGAVYDMFDEKEHVVTDWTHIWGRPDRPPFEKVVAGIDHGTSNPTAMVLIGLYKGTWYAFAEHRHEGQNAGGKTRTNSDHSAAHRTFLENGGIVPRYTVLDPSAAAYRAQLKRDGLPGTKEVENADNDVLQGIQVVSMALSAGLLKIHHSCTELIKEMMTYVWDEKIKEEKQLDKPVKLHDHSLDALRYACMRAIGRRQTRIFNKPSGA